MKLISREEELRLLEEANKLRPPVRHKLGKYYSKMFNLVEQDERGVHLWATSPGSYRIVPKGPMEDCVGY